MDLCHSVDIRPLINKGIVRTELDYHEYQYLGQSTTLNKEYSDKGSPLAEYTYTDIVDKGKTYVSSNFAWESAGYFWDVVKNLNPTANKGASALLDVSKRINGVNLNGYPNGWVSRQLAYKNVCGVIN
jgi:antitoxin component YwqK of YwqJK toxin-antitoxin module